MRNRFALCAVMLVAACEGDAPSPCAPDEAYFRERVWAPVLENRCNICHNPDGLAQDSDFVLTPPGGDAAADMNRNFDRAKKMATETEEGVPLLLRRPTGNNHPGGMVIAIGSVEYRALEEFVGRVRGDEGACDGDELACEAGDPGPRMLRRLSRAEYDNTLSALFGINARYAPTLVADVVVKGFDNNARALEVSPLLADQLRQAAEEVAATVAARPSMACSGDGATCARAWLESTGARVFRRPLGVTEIERWLGVYQVGRDNPDQGVLPHTSGMALVIAGTLQSPWFLYRSELGELGADGRYALTSYEIAAELSYFLWAAPPDDDLWAAAVRDELRDPAAIESHARRLLASPKARASIDRFTAQWLGVDRLETVARDPMLYAAFTPAVRAAMGEEAARQVAAAVQRGATLADVLGGRTTWVNADLARYYGVAAPTSVDAAGFGEVDAASRPGILASGAVLTTHARSNSSSPIHRGKLVRERLLCQELPPPPPGVNARPPPLDPTLTTRERYLAHATDAACSGCHKLMDPIGFAFEHYDGIGRYRADEGGLPIDASGEILASDGSDGAFDGVGALGAHLATSAEVHDCFSIQWVRWAYGVEEDAQLGCLVDEIEDAFEAKAYVIEDLIVALTQTSHFRFRKGVEPTTDPVTDPDPEPDPDPDPEPDPEPDTPGVTAAVTKTDQWATGYCAKLVVTNTSQAPVTWRVTVTIEGTMYNHWNGQLTQAGARLTGVGAPFNATIGPGVSAEAGFCANL